MLECIAHRNKMNHCKDNSVMFSTYCRMWQKTGCELMLSSSFTFRRTWAIINTMSTLSKYVECCTRIGILNYFLNCAFRARIYPFSAFPGKVKFVQERENLGKRFHWKGHISATKGLTEKYNLSKPIYREQGFVFSKYFKCMIIG